MNAIIAGCVFFTPHANSRIVASAFKLGYQGVNATTLYVGMGLIALAYWIFKPVSYRFKIFTSFIAGLIAAILMIICYWSSPDSRKTLYITAQVFASLDFAIALVLLNENVTSLTMLTKT